MSASVKNTPQRVFSISIAWLVVAFLLLPMLITIPISLTPERYISMPDGEISFRHYQALFIDPVWRNAIIDSLVVAFGAMILASAVGSAAAIGLWHIGGTTARYIAVLPMIPLIVPPVVSALVFSRAAMWFNALDTYTTLITAHAIIGLPFVFMTVTASLESVDPRIVQAARSMGVGPLRALIGIVVPNVKAGMMTGALFAFFTSWDEVVVAMFVTARNVLTLPRKIMADLRDNIDPSVAAISAVMITLTLLIAALYLVIGALRARTVKN